MEKEFHAIVVDKSQKDLEIFNKLDVISKKMAGNWGLYKISSKESELADTTKTLQDNMAEGMWYFHFYNEDGSKLIIVFKDRIFETDNHPENWTEAIQYGESLDIPKAQLDFSPNTFADEYY